VTDLLGGRVVAVTGGGAGIGLACVVALAGAGAAVVSLDRDEAAAAALGDLAGSLPGQVVTLTGAAADPDQLHRMVA
jgi:3-hydroxybutyrate dehydrogenase